ncbi:porphobilinogen deaminase [Methanocaldococcus villosus KIN24-T80]|uniref:Hydroxymethylbilane synthase n=1 Tax=Methanocaldococcus villosus KIN24-T80 TaxID=1069083 RepID=N6VU35_9EURY|nr:hydroxymethylbilane synthase [Methanocaldococcus villosus]ENN96701.1 porphobilinogen deaminase [Methanocaldococcus villosus KIN24-T80]
MIVGTRGSKLALCQTEKVVNELKKLGYDVNIKIIKTTGDKILDKKLSDIGIGVFTKELDLALLNNEIDIAVHSYKDIPTVWHDELTVAAVLKRDSPYDLMIWRKDVKDIKVIGTSSQRRRAFLKELYPNAEFKLLRGNVDTRLRKLRDKMYDAIVLAEAGIERLKIDLSEFNYKRLNILPAPAQGIIAVACRKGDREIINILKKINHEESYLLAECERAALRAFGGGCLEPFGALAEYKDNILYLKAKTIKKEALGRVRCKIDDIKMARQLGEDIGRILAS